MSSTPIRGFKWPDYEWDELGWAVLDPETECARDANWGLLDVSDKNATIEGCLAKIAEVAPHLTSEQALSWVRRDWDGYMDYLSMPS